MTISLDKTNKAIILGHMLYGNTNVDLWGSVFKDFPQPYSDAREKAIYLTSLFTTPYIGHLKYATLYIWVSKLDGASGSISTNYPAPSTLPRDAHGNLVKNERLLEITLPVVNKKYIGLDRSRIDEPYHPALKWNFNELVRYHKLPVNVNNLDKDGVKLTFFDAFGDPVVNNGAPLVFTMYAAEAHTVPITSYYPEMVIYVAFSVKIWDENPSTQLRLQAFTQPSEIGQLFFFEQYKKGFAPLNGWRVRQPMGGVHSGYSDFAYGGTKDTSVYEMFSSTYAWGELPKNVNFFAIAAIDFQFPQTFCNTNSYNSEFYNAFGFFVYKFKRVGTAMVYTLGLPYLSERGALFYAPLFDGRDVYGCLVPEIRQNFDVRSLRPIKMKSTPSFTCGDDPCSNLKKWTFEVEIEI